MADAEPAEGMPRKRKPRRRQEGSIEELKLRAQQLVSAGGEKELFNTLKQDLMVNYLLEVKAGQDMETNPQHSRASRKQAKEIAELLIQLSSRGS
jgi:hypothetical protein